MITNKDLSIDSKNGQVILNGDKYDLGTQGEIDAAVKDVYSVMGEMGAKNLIVYPYRDSTKTVNGVTFTLNSDGTVTASTDENGATGEASFALCWRTDNRWNPPNGNYIFTGCPQGGSNSTYYIEVNSTRNGSAYSYGKDYGNGLVISKELTDTSMGAGITIKQGTVLTTPIVFYPMLRLAADTDNTYQPYAKTNRQLTEVIGDLSGTGVTGDTVAAQIKALNDAIATVINA